VLAGSWFLQGFLGLGLEFFLKLEDLSVLSLGKIILKFSNLSILR
jgi:hypothetical protein